MNVNKNGVKPIDGASHCERCTPFTAASNPRVLTTGNTVIILGDTSPPNELRARLGCYDDDDSLSLLQGR